MESMENIQRNKLILSIIAGKLIHVPVARLFWRANICGVVPEGSMIGQIAGRKLQLKNQLRW